MVGLNWNNAFIDGNKLGLAFGSYSSYATEMKGDSDPDDENFAIEAYYDYQVSDNITITPAMFWVEDADGAASVDGSTPLAVLSKQPSSSDHSEQNKSAPRGAFFWHKKGGHLPP